ICYERSSLSLATPHRVWAREERYEQACTLRSEPRCGFCLGLRLRSVAGDGGARAGDAREGGLPHSRDWRHTSAPRKYGQYRDVAVPLAKQAGLQVLAGGTTGQPSFQLLEGSFPYQGRVGVERFRSMRALLDFWRSDTYQQVKKLRTQANFIIAVEG